MNGTRSVEATTVASFWSKVDVRRPGVCWEWRAAKNEHGYGVFRRRDSRLNIRAHRMAWQIVNSEVLPPEVKLLHSCDNPGCVNPGHLSKGTQADNVADMHEKGRRKYDARYTTAEIAEMRIMLSLGKKQHDIAALFGCSQSYVSMLLDGSRGVSIEGEKNG